jgi:hypothetical protein
VPDEQRQPTDVDGEVRRWFEHLGYALEVSLDDDGVFWACLTSLGNPDFTVEKYGRGTTRREAAEAARRRWRVEQIGSPAGRPANQDRRLP